MPITIGTRHATRAVVEGTKKERMKPQRMMPITTRLGVAPILESVRSAMRLSSPVLIMAAARKSAAPTKQKAGDEKPVSAVFMPAVVPMMPVPSGLGESPISTAMSAMMRPPETGKETAVLDQVITAKTMMPIMRCPATVSPCCSGARQMSASAMKAKMRPKRLKKPGFGSPVFRASRGALAELASVESGRESVERLAALVMVVWSLLCWNGKRKRSKNRAGCVSFRGKDSLRRLSLDRGWSILVESS